MSYFKRKGVFWGVIFSATLLFSQAVYYLWIFQGCSTLPASHSEVVLVYGGENWRFAVALQRAASLRRPLYFSGRPSEIERLGLRSLSFPIQVTLDSNAFNTDQNARDAAAYIKSNGFHHVELMTSWFHMPRALLLTQIYLWKTGVEVKPYWPQPVPKDWWKVGYFWIELIKFWGSLTRVFLGGMFGWSH